LHYILESDFDDQVFKEPGPVLVFFCTESQAPCLVMVPTMSFGAQEHRGKVKVIAIDVYINKELPKAYNAGYFEVPVTILFSGGVEKGGITGAASKEAVEHRIENPQAFAKKAASQDPLEAISSVPESDFSDPVLRANVPVLVYFYSSNDASRQVSPLVSQAASDHQGTLRVIKVDSNTESRLAA
jgi:thioredoxin-like negative regulator of GroEL